MDFIIAVLKKPFSLMEPYWSNMLGMSNPYTSPWKVKLSKQIPEFDSQAYTMFPTYNFVYDKLWVATSQGLQGGTLETLLTSPPQKHSKYPIFIKPRWGHKSASSKNCYKINSYQELQKYKTLQDIIWTEYIDEREGMTDFLVYRGRIVYYICYVYSKKQNGVVADEWKYVDKKNKPPDKMFDWVLHNMSNYSGICNLQYRGDKIIEVSLRLARGGAYVYSTQIPELVENINELVLQKNWDYTKAERFKFNPFYAFKCFTRSPLIYIPPYHVLRAIMKKNNCLAFFEYYFEPSGKSGMAFFQFMHEDFETGMRIKKQIEDITNYSNYFFYCMILLLIGIFLTNSKKNPKKNEQWRMVILLVVFLLFSTRFINSGYATIGYLNAHKQSFT